MTVLTKVLTKVLTAVPMPGGRPDIARRRGAADDGR
jgi:hypothetical protein